ncbi:sugar ABC transporter permease [Clostridium sp. HBUAS56010]|uniref:carbohydrate ABC transporter permease n=1 Tax=Clostridium sp. HBUAS56010 TaxID=2571127 RepID=UPI001A9ADFA5|nr:sugar ABC transporter permease [Clostridium sp. HBUAS56010]
MAKTITESQKQEKIAALQKRRDSLSLLLSDTGSNRRRDSLIAKIEKIDENIKKIRTGQRFTRQEKRNLVAYSFIAPNFIGFAVFTLGPIIFAFVLAFMEWDGNSSMKFAGLSNFVAMFVNARFQASFINTIVYCAATVPLTLVCALLLAVVLNQKIKGRNFFRTVSFFPYVASLVAVAAVWNMLFSPMKSGPVNMILYNLGVHAKSLPKWAADPHWVMFTIILFSVWKNMGYYMIIYLAGLQGINGELYEAAGLDGCNTWQKFRYITWPQLQPTTFFVTIILTINCFKVYDIVYMLAGGSNGIVSSQAMVLVYHIYEEAFRNWNLGYASAVAMVLFLMVLAVTLVQFRGERKYAN